MSAAPVQDRIQSLDVMRGFAVLGILAVNAALFAAPWQASANPNLAPLDVNAQTLWSWLAMHVLFEFKCITLFSLLFGASLYLVGGERGDVDRGRVLHRRLLWLLVFGLIHATLIWYGDILVTYALTGFLVMRARSWPTYRLMIGGAVLYALTLGLMHLAWLVPPDELAAMKSAIWAPAPTEVERVQAAYQGGLVSALRENLSTWLLFISSSIAVLVARTAGVMMIGMALLKMGFLSGKAPVWVYGFALALGAGALGLIGWQAWLNARADFEFAHMQVRGTLANAALSILVSVAYASLFVLLVKAGARLITAPLAAVGRMAFTNYIAQSLIMTTIFWGGRGFGLFGELDRPALWAIVWTIWAVQLIWSPLWLSRFQMGPLEWVWRRLSYARPVAMMKDIR